MADPTARMETSHEEGCVVIRLSGDLDLVTVPRLEPQIERAIAGAPDVVVDLTEIQFLDSGGLRLLTRVSSTAAAHNQSLVVVAPPNSIARSVLEIAGMKADSSFTTRRQVLRAQTSRRTRARAFRRGRCRQALAGAVAQERRFDPRPRARLYGRLPGRSAS